jgi:hypothetical protein
MSLNETQKIDSALENEYQIYSKGVALLKEYYVD